MSDAKSGPRVPDDVSIRIPTETAPLLDRLAKLLATEYTTPRVRGEAGIIIQLLRTKRIYGRDAWRQVALFYGHGPESSLNPDVPSDWLDPIRADQRAVWDNLVALTTPGHQPAPIRGVLGPHDEAGDADTELAQHWLAQIIRHLELLAERYGVKGATLLDQLPHTLSYGIEHVLANNWLGGPFAMGASMHGLPLGGGQAFGMKGQGVYALKALAHILQTELAMLERLGDTTQDPDPTAAAEARGRVVLMWSFLKGFVDDAVDTDSPIIREINHHQGLAGLIIAGLRAGREVATSADILPVWGSASGGGHNYEIRQTPVEELIKRFLAVTAAERVAEADWADRIAP